MRTRRIVHVSVPVLVATLTVLGCVSGAFPRAAAEEQETSPVTIGFHEAVYDDAGKLLPWTSWDEILRLEMEWYLGCPSGEKDYPVYFYATSMDDDFEPYCTDFIPATQLGMGVVSYVKYWRYLGKSDRRVMKQALRMGDFLIDECLTPDEGAYPRFPRSTGDFTTLPIERSAQGDATHGPNVIEPDKGGIVGYAFLVLLSLYTHLTLPTN